MYYVVTTVCEKLEIECTDAAVCQIIYDLFQYNPHPFSLFGYVVKNISK